MEGEQTIQAEGLEYFISGEQKGLRLKITPDIELSVLKETVIEPKSGQTSFSGIEGMFAVKGGKGDMRVDPRTEFHLRLEGMDEADVPEVVEALGTLVKIGARPKEVADFVSDVESKRLREQNAKFTI